MTYDDFSDELARLHQSGRLRELIARSDEIVELFRIRYGEEHSETANAISGSAFAYYDMGEWHNAAAQWSRVCQIHLAIFSERSPQYVQSLCDVARADLLAGEIEKAEGLVVRAMTILESIPGDHRLVMITTSVLRARLRVQKKDYVTAEHILLDAMRLRLRQLEEEYGRRYNWVDRLLSDIFACLSWVLAHQGNLRAAKGSMQKALRIRQPEFDNIHPYYARMLSTLGEIQRRQGDFTSAETSQRTALQILRRIRPEGHFDVSLAERRLANVEARNEVNSEKARA